MSLVVLRQWLTVGLLGLAVAFLLYIIMVTVFHGVADPTTLTKALFQILATGSTGPVAAVIAVMTALLADFKQTSGDNSNSPQVPLPIRSVLVALLAVLGICLCQILPYIIFDGDKFITVIAQNVFSDNQGTADAKHTISTLQTCFGGFLGLLVGLNKA
jgi:type IV secretory pathway VirB2 component (pilin)